MAGYTRQDTANNIANGNVIDADDFDAEYNALESAFNASTGHKHDGTSGEGAPITKVGPSQDLVVSATQVKPKTTNTLDLGTSSLQYKDGYFDGVVYQDGAVVGVNAYMTLSDNEIDVSSGDLTLDVAGDIILDVDGADILMKDAGTQFAAFTNNSANLILKSGSTTAATFTGANVDLAGTLDVTGNTTLDGTLTVVGNVSSAAGNLTLSSGNATVGGTLGVTGAATLSSTLAVSGIVTANAGVVVDNITIDGQDIDLSSGDLTVDVDGDVILDADGGDVILKDAGVQYGSLTNTSGNLIVKSGSTTAATFSGANVTLAGNATISGNTTLTGNLTANGNVTLGDAATDTVTITADVASNVIPSADSTYTIGDNTNRWSHVYSDALTLTNDATISGNATVTGNLTVNGTTTTLNTTNTVVSDSLIELGNGTSGTPANDAGIVIERGTSSNAFMGWDESVDKFTVGTGTFTGASTGNLAITTGTLVANIEGNVTGNVTGNADTATTLATSRTISLTGDVSGSTSFDGSGNVSITATVADDSHNHVISNIDGLQTEIDTKAELAGSASQAFSASTLNATTVDLGDWTITQSGTDLKFAYQGVDRLKLSSAGALTVEDDVTAFGNA